ncbi:MBL fold metallo-hydrolase [Senegalimassilia faecalis]|uniref:MBL fold metallo-hydrolase n=1 Tax=Senegalimassilia faecalis TaxID=2509433 RepID=UPI003A976B98
MDGRIEQVHQNPDVYKIEVPFENISTSATNCYVVKDGDDALVVDTGAPTDEGAAVLSAALDELAVDRDRAKWFLTHLHMDHAGLVDQVVPDGGFLLIGANEVAAVRASRTGMFLETLRRVYRRQGVPLASLSVAARLGIEVQMFDPARLRTLLLHDGDTVTVGRWEFKVVETPGHTPGHLSLFHPESRILFGGDHALFVISPSIALFADGQDGLQTYFDSMQKVQNLGISQLYHSHGPIRDGFEERFAWLVEHHEARLAEAEGVIARIPHLTGYKIIRTLKWNVPFDEWDDIPIMQRWCILTQGIVYLNHLVATGGIAAKNYGDGVLLYESTQ